MHQFKLPISVLALDFSIVIVQRLQVLVAINGSACQPHVKCSQHADILEIFIFDKLYNDILLGLNLKHLQGQTQEGSWLYVATIDTTHEP